MQLILRLLLVICMLVVQTACVSTGPQRLSRAEAQEIKPGEAITLTFKDGRKIRSRFQGLDDSGLNTDQGYFEHAAIRHLEVERFSAGETAMRTVGFVYLLGLAGAVMMGKMLSDAFEGGDD